MIAVYTELGRTADAQALKSRLDAERSAGADPASVAWKRTKLGWLLARHGDHARAQYLAAAASAETLHVKDALMYYLRDVPLGRVRRSDDGYAVSQR